MNYQAVLVEPLGPVLGKAPSNRQGLPMVVWFAGLGSSCGFLEGLEPRDLAAHALAPFVMVAPSTEMVVYL